MTNDLVVRKDLVFVQGDEVLTDSLRIAEAFGRRPDNVRRDIQSLIKLDPEISSHYEEIEYVDGRGRRQPAYTMTETGFLALVPGFKGEKATRLRIKVALVFQAMRKQLQAIADNRDDPDRLQQIASSAALTALVKSPEFLTVTDAAKTLEIPPRQLSAWLEANGWCYRRQNSGLIAYQNKIKARLLVHVEHEIRLKDALVYKNQVKVTTKGLAHLAELFSTKRLAAE